MSQRPHIRNRHVVGWNDRLCDQSRSRPWSTYCSCFAANWRQTRQTRQRLGVRVGTHCRPNRRWNLGGNRLPLFKLATRATEAPSTAFIRLRCAVKGLETGQVYDDLRPMRIRDSRSTCRGPLSSAGSIVSSKQSARRIRPLCLRDPSPRSLCTSRSWLGGSFCSPLLGYGRRRLSILLVLSVALCNDEHRS